MFYFLHNKLLVTVNLSFSYLSFTYNIFFNNFFFILTLVSSVLIFVSLF